ncbi:MAG: hypothetical protein ACFB10_11860, partial [Salibacteraceae bacterium]
MDGITAGWTWLINITAPNILGMEGELAYRITGSGDRAYDWVQSFLWVVLSLIGGTLWTVLDRHRSSYQRLWRWGYLLFTYYLIYNLFGYGFIKAFGEQFGYPSIGRLLETYGESSPMRLLWTFMSASEAYEQFSGWGEAIAGLLLLFHRTRTLGALVAFGVMLNVFLLNMTYDVPVKLFSFQLVLISLYIAGADYQRLLGVFLQNKPVGSVKFPTLFTTRWKRYTFLGVQVLFAVYIMAEPIISGIETESQYNPDRPRPALYGIHEVELFVANGDTLPPLTTDTLRWGKAFMDLPGFNNRLLWGIKGMNNRLRYLVAKLDTTEQVLTLSSFRDTSKVYHLDYTFEEENLHLSGVFEEDTLVIQTKYFNPDEFILLKRGFNWINDVPYNRSVPQGK